MAKKRNKTTVEKPEEPLGENWTNPFAGLNVKVEEPPAPPPPPPPTKEELAAEALSDDDKALLKAFGGDAADSPALARANLKKKVERLWLTRERKGRGGKEVTLVHGLENLDTMLQMELCGRIKEALGIGGQFADGVLMLQGDQRDRAASWFEKNGFQIKGRNNE